MSTEWKMAPAHFGDRVKRLMDAMEGELDGLSCAPDVAAEILAYVDTGLAPDERAIRAAPDAPASFQARVAPWMQECFGSEVSADRLERGDRLLEEVFELLQSGGFPVERVAAIRDYVWGRPAGEPVQEVGGVMVTLAAYCLAHGLDMHDAGEIELARISTPEMIAKIRAKQAAKPKGSALPVAAPDAPGEPVAFNATHRHKKRGSVYRVIGEAEAQVSTGSYNGCGYSRRVEDGSRLTVYEAEDGRLWARFTDEFDDGRFEALSPLSHKEG